MATKKAAMTSFNPLVLLLILAALAIGYLFSQVQSLKSGSAKVADSGDSGQAAPEAAAPEVPPADLDKMPDVTAEDHVRGAKDAPLTLVVYSDYECPFCKTFHETMLQVMEEYDGKVKFAFRHFPLSFHANAQKEAEASECIAELGGNDAFWDYTDAIFERTTSNGTGIALDDLGPLAAELGVDQTAFQDCLDSDKYAQKVQDDMAGGSAAGVNGTPGTIIVAEDGERSLIPGALPFDQVKTQLDALL